ncbi:MAG: helix-turn-helix domain-containing protein [Acidimicrobiales bacterium]
MSYLTVQEVAARLRVSDLTVRRWIWAGKLPAMRVGRVLRIQQADVDSLGQNSRSHLPSSPEEVRPGSAAALLAAAAQCSHVVRPEDVEELEQLIAAACERPGEAGPAFG